MSPRRKQHTTKDVRTFRACKIKVVQVISLNYGHHQGYKVYVDNRKYPRTLGEWYHTSFEKLAVRAAITEHLDGLYRRL
jgi:hypothetical protein